MPRPQPTSRSGRPRRTTHASHTWLVLADIHYPHHDRRTLRCALEFAHHTKLAGLVLLVNQFDNSCISHHNNGKPLFKPTGQYKRDTLGFERDVLKPLEAALPPAATRVWIIGNHDDWESQLVESQPELKGTIERPLLLHLASRGWKVVPCGKSFRHGKLTYVHGETLTTQHHAKRAVEVFCTNLVYGHFHTPQSFTKVLPQNHTQKWAATCLPIVGSVNPEYMRNKPNAWVNGFALVEYHGSSGSFDLYPVVVTNGRCAYGVVVYNGNRSGRP